MSDQQLLPDMEHSDKDRVMRMDLETRVMRALSLLRDNEPEDGYYVAFSGGKDSCVIKELVRMSGVKHECWYNQTTIDPPELVRFIKGHHADVKWNIPKYGNMMHRVSMRNNGPPTRLSRWCCEEYKEGGGGRYRIKVFGVRASESRGRALRWRETSMDGDGGKAVCPIVYWTDSQVWEFLKHYQVPYCSLYDEGWDRLGCVGCPLAGPDRQTKEFERWPAFERNWKRAIEKNWETYKDKPRKDGKPRYHAKFKSAEDFWNWWRWEKKPDDPFRQDCQSGLLWTNDPSDENEP